MRADLAKRRKGKRGGQYSQQVPVEHPICPLCASGQIAGQFCAECGAKVYPKNEKYGVGFVRLVGCIDTTGKGDAMHLGVLRLDSGLLVELRMADHSEMVGDLSFSEGESVALVGKALFFFEEVVDGFRGAPHDVHRVDIRVLAGGLDADERLSEDAFVQGLEGLPDAEPDRIPVPSGDEASKALWEGRIPDGVAVQADMGEN